MPETLYYTQSDKIVWRINNVVTNEYDESDTVSVSAGSYREFTAVVKHFNLNNIYDLGLYLEPSKSSNKVLEWAENSKAASGMYVTVNGVTRQFRASEGASRGKVLWLPNEGGSQGKLTLAPQTDLTLTFRLSVPEYDKIARYLDLDISLYYKLEGSA